MNSQIPKPDPDLNPNRNLRHGNHICFRITRIKSIHVNVNPNPPYNANPESNDDLRGSSHELIALYTSHLGEISRPLSLTELCHLTPNLGRHIVR